MRAINSKEDPLFDFTKEDVVKYYNLIYSFILELRKKPNVATSYKAALKEPAWCASEILYLSIHGYSKKNKFSRSSQYLFWNKAPKALEKRIIALLGNDFKSYMEGTFNSINTYVEDAIPVTRKGSSPAVNTISYTFRTDDKEVLRRMQNYIEDFDLHSSIDHDILKNLVKTQMLIEYAQDQALMGKSTMFNVKDLTDQLKNYTILLGLSKKDRVDLGAERKKGSIAELAMVYEETLQEYAELETEFLIEELEMLLIKYERTDTDGNREVSAKAFRVVSGGYTIEEAREITGRKRKNAKPFKDNSFNS